MTTYFGKTAIGGTVVHDTGNIWIRNKSYVTGYDCPGVGNQTTKEISLYCRMETDHPGNMRHAVYEADHDLACQGDAEVALVSPVAWQGHLTSGDITPDPCYLTGALQYDIGYSLDTQWSAEVYMDAGAPAAP